LLVPLASFLSSPATEEAKHSSGDDAFSNEQALAAIRIRLQAAHVNAAPPPPAPVGGPEPEDLPWLHLLPCRIAHTGPANVPNYWQPSRAGGASKSAADALTLGPDGSLVSAASAELYDARFRGRQLTGSIVKLGANAKGFLFEEVAPQDAEDQDTTAAAAAADDDGMMDGMDETKEGASSSSAKAPQQQWQSTARFDSFVLWQPDLEVFERRHIIEAVEDWPTIAHAIHGLE
jgi:hypothetical protein